MSATDRSRELTRIAAEAADDKGGKDIVAFDVSEQLALTDVFLIVSASTERAVGAVIDAVEEALLKEGVKRVRREGNRENRWVVLDFGDLFVHVQHVEERVFYALDRLWSDCPAVELPDFAAGAAVTDADLPARD